ncbi:TPA: SagB family peptide dehydrogenase [Pseudomonas putida]|nr:SagB family peptide dehydrogenase [Pseudomonas putida]
MISEDCFFIVVGNFLICWDFKRHKQYQLTVEHASRLVSLIYEGDCTEVNDAIADDLKRCRVLLESAGDGSVWGWDVLSRIFHDGTKDIILEDQPSNEHEWAAQYLKHCKDVLDKPLPPEAAQAMAGGISLPSPCATHELDEVFRRRATAREFYRIPISLAVLGEILHLTLGFVEHRMLSNGAGGVENYSRRRSSPSVGGLNATEGYVYVNNVEGLDPGVYYYDPHRHQLHWRSELGLSLGDLLCGQHFANDIPVGLFLTSRLDKLWWKYEHSRAYRVALIEIGHVAQTFQLAATARGMNTWLTGALNECKIEPLLKLENSNEQVLFFVGCGYSNGSATPICLRSLMD